MGKGCPLPSRRTRSGPSVDYHEEGERVFGISGDMMISALIDAVEFFQRASSVKKI